MSFPDLLDIADRELQTKDTARRAAAAGQGRFSRYCAPLGHFVREAPQTDEGVRAVLRAAEVRDDRTTCWVAGGALRDLVSGTPRKDVDVFFSDAEFAVAASRRMVDDPSLAVSCVEDSVDVRRLHTRYGWVDLVMGAYYSSALHVVDRFDFTACAAVVDARGRGLQHAEFEEDARARRLVVNALPTPVASFWRYHRFRVRGWWMDPEEYRGLLREAVERPEAQGWLSGDTPGKGMPPWAEAAWMALRETSDAVKLTAAMRRAAVDPAWVAELESTAALTGCWTVAETEKVARQRWQVVREFICATVGTSRDSGSSVAPASPRPSTSTSRASCSCPTSRSRAASTACTRAGGAASGTSPARPTGCAPQSRRWRRDPDGF